MVRGYIQIFFFKMVEKNVTMDTRDIKALLNIRIHSHIIPKTI